MDETDSFGATRISDRWFERHWHLNGSNIRDDVEATIKPVSDLPRIRLVGDSFTAAHGVKDVDRRFANLIRRERTDWSVEVLARNGWSTADHVRVLEKLGRSGPDLGWVVVVYVLNDMPEMELSVDGHADELLPDNLFTRHSFFLNTWSTRFQAGKIPEMSDYFERLSDAYRGQAWQRQKTRLSQLRQVVESGGGHLLVVTFPFLHELDGDYGQRFAHTLLAEFWREEGVPHLDLLPLFDGRPTHQLCVNRNDMHPNEGVHAEAARAIVSFVDSHVLGSTH